MKKKVIIIGGGASSLILADILKHSHDVHIYEKGKAIGRKFLVAGNGGFNLTHSISNDALLEKYSNHPILHECLKAFDTEDTRKWLEEIGIPTYVGSSNRVFPEKGIKPVHVLQKIKDRLVENNVHFHFHHEFMGFSETGVPIIKNKEDEFQVNGDYYVFALGGASWSKTGSDGKWTKAFQDFGIKCVPFQASNCGINIDWDKDFITKHEGTPLKNIQIKIDQFSIKGEALITKYGLEGNAIYPCIPYIRKKLNQNKATSIDIDFKPNNATTSLVEKIGNKSIKPKNYGYIFNLNKTQLDIIKNVLSKDAYFDIKTYIATIKSTAIEVASLRSIEESISTIGGISMEEINPDFSLKKDSNIFIAGEMLDWDAPTGGFLLQGCFSIGAMVAKTLQINYKDGTHIF